MKKYNFSFIRLLTVLMLTGILISCNGKAHSPDKQEGTMKTSRENVLKNWRDMGFGMFIHWGAYTELKGRWKGQELTKDLWGEWIMKRAGIPIPEYEKAIKPFNPSKFDAAHWVELAKNAGMKYMVITAKHHDGFAMYPSDASPYNLRDFCGFRRDPMKELSEECRKQDMAFGFYYSHRIDWHAKGADKYMGNDTTATFDDYWKRKCLPQVTELTTRYGQLAVMWFDLGGSLPLEKAKELRGLVLKNQPGCVISSRIGAGQGDYKSQKDRFVPLAPIIEPWETPMTLNNHWAWYPQDTDYKNARDLIRMLIAVRSMGGNLLLNIGPDNTGQIPAVETVVLKQVGKWMKKYGDAIYGISPSPLPSFPWGRCTMKGNKLYLHVFDWPADGKLVVPGITNRVKTVYLMSYPDIKINYVNKEADLILTVPKNAPDKINSVIVLDIDGGPDIVYAPEIKTNSNVFIDTLSVTLRSNNNNSEIHYTMDNSIPDTNSPFYDSPLFLSKTTIIKAAAFRDGKRVSSISKRTLIRDYAADRKINGLKYAYYEGSWEKMPDFNKLKAEKNRQNLSG